MGQNIRREGQRPALGMASRALTARLRNTCSTPGIHLSQTRLRGKLGYKLNVFADELLEHIHNSAHGRIDVQDLGFRICLLKASSCRVTGGFRSPAARTSLRSALLESPCQSS